MIPTKAAIEARAKQLFEEETGRHWDRKSCSATEDEKREYQVRAERELKDIDQEGHS